MIAKDPQRRFQGGVNLKGKLKTNVAFRNSYYCTLVGRLLFCLVDAIDDLD